MKHKLVFTLFLIASLTHAQEQKQSYSFSLQQAIEHAIENNYSSKRADKDIDAAKQKKWETTAAGLPQIGASLDYQNNFVLQKSVVPAEFFGGNPGEFAEVAFGTRHNMFANGRLTQLIFDGSYIVALQASKTYLKFFENAKQKTNTEIREMVINAYGNVLLAEESILILEKNQANLKKTLSDTEATYKNGLIEEENVEQLQITMATINSSLNNSKRLLDIATKMLKYTLGIDLDSELKLSDKLDNLSISNMNDVFDSTNFNVTNSIDYQIANNFQEQRTLELKLQKSKALPSLAAVANFGYNAFSDQFAFFTQNQKWLNYSNLGISLNVPIFSSFGRKAKTQQAKIALDQAKIQLTETEQQLKLQHERAKSEFEFSIEEYATSKSNLNLAERIEKKQQIKFTEGLSSSFDFSEAQRQLYTAQQNYLQSMVNIISKKAALDKLLNKN